MELPIVGPAPVVADPAAVFRDLFDNQRQVRHFQHYVTRLIVLPNKSMANSARCILDSADKTNLFFLAFSRRLPGGRPPINRRRIHFDVLRQTKPRSAAPRGVPGGPG